MSIDIERAQGGFYIPFHADPTNEEIPEATRKWSRSGKDCGSFGGRNANTLRTTSYPSPSRPMDNG